MEENKNMQIEEIIAKQYKMTKIMTVCTAVIAVVLLLTVVVVVPKLMETLSQVDVTLKEVETLSATVNEELPQLIENVNQIMGNENSGLTEAIENFNNFDIEGLNEAINSLKSVVEPLAKLFGR